MSAHLSDHEASELRSLLSEAAEAARSGWPAADLPDRLRAARARLLTPEMRAREASLEARR